MTDPTVDGAGAPSGAPVVAPRAAGRVAFAERRKELDLHHRNRFRSDSALAATLSLRLLRGIAAGWLRPQVVSAPPRIARPDSGLVAVTFIGHVTVMLTWATVRVLVDPFFASSVAGARRRRAACLAVGDAMDVDLILITGVDRDRLHADSLRKLPRTATLVIPSGTAERVAGLGFNQVIELAAGEIHEHRGCQVHAVGSSRADTLGYVARATGRSIYCAGATGYFDGFSAIGEQQRPDVAVLPIGGYRPLPLRRTHLSPLDAVFALQDLGARILVPVGHGSFLLGHESSDEPLGWLRDAAQHHHVADRLRVLDHGESCFLGP